jgi:hypothetical protein
MLKVTNRKTRKLSENLDHQVHGPFQVQKVMTLTAIRVTLTRSSGIHNVFHIDFLEPYQMFTWRDSIDLAQVSRDYDNSRAEHWMIKKIMGCSYNTRETWVIYLVQ